MVDYSGTLPYNPSSTYEIDAVVSFEGDFYISKEAVAINQAPPLHTKWKLAPKLSDSCVDQFWCTFLGEFLSLAVIIDRLPHWRTQVTAEGPIQKMGESFVPANNDAYRELYGSFLGRKDSLFRNMYKHVKSVLGSTTESSCKELFDTLKFIEGSCCGGCGEYLCDCSCDDNCLDGRMLYEVA